MSHCEVMYILQRTSQLLQSLLCNFRSRLQLWCVHLSPVELVEGPFLMYAYVQTRYLSDEKLRVYQFPVKPHHALLRTGLDFDQSILWYFCACENDVQSIIHGTLRR